MSEKRRGLGRGLGALIPSAPEPTRTEGQRPVDVFFPDPVGRVALPPLDDSANPAALPKLLRADGGLAERTGAGSPAAGRPPGGRGTSPAVTSTAATDSTDEARSGATATDLGAAGATATAPTDGAGVETAFAATTSTATTSTATTSGVTGTETTDGVTGTETTDGVTETSSATDAYAETGSENGGSAQLAVGSVTEGETSSGTARDEASAPERTRQSQPRPFLIDSVSRETYEAATGMTQAPELVPVPGATFAELPVMSIHPNSRQPRTVFDENDLAELVGSIREIGVLQPIVVRPSRGRDGYELIMGERRWRATQEAGLATIPAIIRETEDSDLLRDALLENLHRSDLNPLEEAAAYRQLLDDFGCTHEELATRISRSRPQISNTLRLLRLPPLVQRRVAAGVLSAGHARALLGLTDGSEIERLAQRIVAEGISVRATEEIVAMGGLEQEKKAPSRPRPGGRIGAIEDLASRLSDRFETRVKVDLGKTKGKLTVEFASVEDLNRILDVMVPDDPGLFKKDA